MDAVEAPGAVPQARFDPRGLVELDETIPRIAEIDGERASFDARHLTTRQINLELRRLIYELGVREVTVRNPGAKHSLGVGILTRCQITFAGSLGYFGCGVIDGPEVHITGRVGWSACENMMSGRMHHRWQRRFADRGGPAWRRRGRARPGRCPHRDRPEGRDDHLAR